MTSTPLALPWLLATVRRQPIALVGRLRKPQIQVEIKRQKEAIVDDLGVGVQRIIAEYMKIVFADIFEYVDFGQQDVPMFTEEGMPINDPKTGELMTYKRNLLLSGIVEKLTER